MERVRGNAAGGYQNGVAFVYGPDGDFVTQFGTETSKHTERLPFEPGALLTVRVMVHSPDSTLLDRTFRVRVTEDEEDRAVAAICHPEADERGLASGPDHYYFGVRFEQAVLVSDQQPRSL